MQLSIKSFEIKQLKNYFVYGTEFTCPLIELLSFGKEGETRNQEKTALTILLIKFTGIF